MLKLMRNILAEKGILTDQDNNQIRWQHIKDLHELQDREGLKAANKLKRSHVEWYQQKMKVSLAAQCMSRSVANALEFLGQDLHLSKFTDVAPTVAFIRVIDRLFDTLNSKNKFEKEFKSVLRCENERFWRPFLMQTAAYLSNLKLFGVPLHQTMRKTAVIGFLATINSVIGLFDDFVSTKIVPYLATYRLSQDHIELLFNVVRSRGRWNNNPTAGQFRMAYRQLLMKHSITPNKAGNVISQEETVLLSSVGLVERRETSVTTAEILKRFGLGQSDGSIDHDYALTPDRIHISEFSANIVTYMAGYVSRKLCKTITCVGCKLALISNTKVVENCKLIQRKDAGGLLYPSQSVVDVCTVTERCIRFVCGNSSDSIPKQRNLHLALQIAVLERIQLSNLFLETSDDHSCVVDVFESHVLNLVRLITNAYMNIRFYSVGKIFSDKLRGKNIRFNSNKNVLFAHQ